MSTAAIRLQSDRLKYPGLLPEETIVLRAWLVQNQQTFDRFDYNFHIGPDQDPGPQYSEATRKSVIAIMKSRIDAVGWRGVQNSLLPVNAESPTEIYALFPSALATIIEVKRRATNTAIGQILSYWHLWQEQFPQGPKPDMVLVCNTYSPNIIPAIRANGIQLNTVSANFTILSPQRS